MSVSVLLCTGSTWPKDLSGDRDRQYGAGGCRRRGHIRGQFSALISLAPLSRWRRYESTCTHGHLAGLRASSGKGETEVKDWSPGTGDSLNWVPGMVGSGGYWPARGN